MRRRRPQHELHQPLYTDLERRRRDASPWTLVQAVLAPVQFLVFLVSFVVGVFISVVDFVFSQGLLFIQTLG